MRLPAAHRKEFVVNTPIKVLLVEDAIEDAEILVRDMRKGGLDIVPRRVDNRVAFEAALEEFDPDLILADYSIPGFGGIVALQIVQQRRSDTPFIFVSGTIGEERAIEALKHGATDYVLKNNRARVVPSILRALNERQERRARRQAELEREESDRRFRLFMRHMPGVVFLEDLDGQFAFINQEGERILGRPAAEIVREKINRFFPFAPAPDDKAAGPMTRGTGQTIDAVQKVPTVDGIRSLLFEKFPIPDLDGKTAMLGGIALDITKLIEAEEAQAISEERFRSIADATQEWIWEMDAQGIYTYCNHAVTAILGYAIEEVIGTDGLEYLHEDERPAVIELRRAAAAEKRGWRNWVSRWRHKDGSGTRRLESNALPLFGRDGACVGFRGVDRDITERIEQHDKIARLSRIQAVLSGINSAIVRVHNQQDLFREVCRIAVDHGRFRMASISLVAHGAARTEPAAWAGFEDGYFAAAAAAPGNAEEDDGVSGQALRQKTPVVVNDIGADPGLAFRHEALKRGYRSLMALPLLQQDEAIGVLTLHASEPSFFDQDEVKLLKDLAADISYALDHIASEARLAYVSYYDALTGLANRQLFFDRLTLMMKNANSERRNLAVMVIDLRRFRNINDTLGRGAGDKLLKEFARRLLQTFGEAAAPARMSSDRFAVTITDQRGLAMARRIESWVVDALVEPFVIEEVELRLAVKIGIALFPEDGESAESLFMNAEAALQRAKDTSDTYVFYSPEINARLARGLHLESRMRQAVENKEFALLYQPKVDLQTRKIIGLEALIRWRDPERGLIPPHNFISVLEDTGMIVQVGRWVIEQVVCDMRLWRECKLTVPRVAVNVSQVQLRRDDFVATVLEALGAGADEATGFDLEIHEGLIVKDTGARPLALPAGANRSAGVDLEITESLVAEDTEANMEKLRQLRAAGMRIYMDDFGTGYSSLSQIARLPLDALKIDRAFIMNMAENDEHMAIVSTIINLAKALHIEVVAEGVETEGQADLLRALGCDQAQGYLFSRPVPVEEIEKLLRAESRL